MPGLGYIRDSDQEVDFLHREGIAFDSRMLGAVENKRRPGNPVGVFPIENQGDYNSCAGHMIQAAQQFAEFRQTGQIVRPSRWLPYLIAQKLCGSFGQDKGSSIAAAVGGATNYGNGLEDECPYPANPPKDRYENHLELPRELMGRALGHRMGSHAFLNSREGALAWLRMELGGFGLGIRWFESYAQTKGMLRASDFGRGRLLGGHALFFPCEAEQVGSDGGPCFWMKNPWGETYGYHGWALVESSLMDLWFRDSFTVGCGLSHLNPWQAKQRVDDFMRGGVFVAGPTSAGGGPLG
jgi:hypothetical protein